MKKNLKNLMALVLAGAMLSAGTAVFADTTEWGEDDLGSNTLTGGGQKSNVDSAISVVVPVASEDGNDVNFVIDPDGIIATAGMENITLDVTGAGTLLFKRTDAEDPDNTIISDKSAPITFTNKSSIPINVKLDIKVNEADTGSNIEMVTNGAFNDKAEKLYIGLSKIEAGSETNADLDKKVTKSEAAGDVEDTELYKVEVENYIKPQIELFIGIENDDKSVVTEAAVKNVVKTATEGVTVANPDSPTEAEQAALDAAAVADAKASTTTLYGMIPDAANLLQLQQKDGGGDFEFEMVPIDEEEENWPVLNAYLKGSANTGSTWSEATIANYGLDITYTLSKVPTAATYNTTSGKTCPVSLTGFSKNTKEIRIKALTGAANVGQQMSFKMADLSGFVTAGTDKVTLTAETMAVLKDTFGGEAKIVVSADGTEGRIFTIK